MIPESQPFWTGDLDNNWQIDTKRLRECRLMIGMPCVGGAVMQPTKFSISRLQEQCMRAGVTLVMQDVYNDGIFRARNQITAEFLASDCTHLLFWDADIEDEASSSGQGSASVFRMLAMNLGIVCGVYPMKGIDWKAVVEEVLNQSEKLIDVLDYDAIQRAGAEYAMNLLPDAEECNGAVEVSEAATGFMMIQRRVFQTMIDKQVVAKLNVEGNHKLSPGAADNYYYFWAPEVDEHGDCKTEDYRFCQMWRRLGGRVWVDPRVKLGHFGPYPFRGDFAKWLKNQSKTR